MAALPLPLRPPRLRAGAALALLAALAILLERALRLPAGPLLAMAVVLAANVVALATLRPEPRSSVAGV